MRVLLFSLGLIGLMGCPGPGPSTQDDDDSASDDDDSADDDDDSADDDSDAPPCLAPPLEETEHDLSEFVVTTFAVQGEGDWNESPCLQASFGNNHPPNNSPGARCSLIDQVGRYEMSNSFPGMGATDDLEVNVILPNYAQEGVQPDDPSAEVEIRIGQAAGEWVHWIGDRWGGDCTVEISDEGRRGAARCTQLAGRYGPVPDDGDEFGRYNLDLVWSCPLGPGGL